MTKSANSDSTREMPPARAPVDPRSEIRTPYPCRLLMLAGVSRVVWCVRLTLFGLSGTRLEDGAVKGTLVPDSGFCGL